MAPQMTASINPDAARPTPPPPSEREFRVGILGATGAVGQRFIQLLEFHPLFGVTRLGASERSAGKRYCDAVKFKIANEIPKDVKDMIIASCDDVSGFRENVDFVFSGLDSSVATEIEKKFSEAGIPVFSNAKNYRMNDDVPILIPYINSSHLSLIRQQRSFRETGGFIITNANCASTGLSIALKPLHDKYEITDMFVTTCQAISGAGYPGLPSLDILDNCVPFISGEEDKVEEEPNKILGKISQSNDAIEFAKIQISAFCHRVAVSDGHLVSVSLKFRTPPKSVEDITKCLQDFSPPLDVQKLQSCPSPVVKVTDKEDRPQPRLDRMEGGGMATVVGRIRKCNLYDYKFTTLSHNTIIGAAGGSILNAELAASKGYIRRSKQ